MGNALATKQETPAATLRSLLERSKDQIKLALPKHMTPERLIRITMTAVQSSPKLMECDALSVVGSVIQAAQLGLEPDGVIGHAYLVPFWNGKTKRTDAKLMIGYRGFLALARNSGEIEEIGAQVVYSKDKFDYEYGLDAFLRHKPAMNDDRGEPSGAYAYARLKGGGKVFEVLSMAEINKARKQSKAADDGPWVTHWAEMARKTAIRRLAKYLPLSVEKADFVRAAVQDEYTDMGVEPAIETHVTKDPSELAEQATEHKTKELKEHLEEVAQKAAAPKERTLNEKEVDQISAACAKNNMAPLAFMGALQKKWGVEAPSKLRVSQLPEVLKWIEAGD